MDLRKLRHIQDLLNGLVENRKRRLPILPTGETDEEKVTSLLEYLSGDPSKRRVSVWKLQDILWLGILWLMIGGVMGCAVFIAHFYPILIHAICFVGMAGYSLLPYPRTFAGYRSALYQLTGYDDSRILSTLLRSISFPDKQLRHAIRVALTRHLNALDVESARNLSSDESARLIRQLNLDTASQYPEFVAAILHTLALQGDMSARIALEKFIRKRASQENGRALQEQARRYLQNWGQSALSTSDLTTDISIRNQTETSTYESVDGEPVVTSEEVSARVPWPLQLSRFQEVQMRSYEQDLALVFLVIVSTLIGIALIPFVPLYDLSPIALIVIIGLGGLWYGRHSKRNSQQRKELLASLALTNSPHAVGPMLETYRHLQEKGAGAEDLVPLLTDLLIRQTSMQKIYLTASQQDILFQLLLNSKSTALKRACLHGTLLLGNARALLPLAKIVVLDAPDKESRALREEAKVGLKRISETLDFGTVEDIPRWIGELFQLNEISSTNSRFAWEWPNAMTAVCALTRLLPLVTPAHARLLSSSARRKLCGAQAQMMWLFNDRGDPLSISISRLGPDFQLAILTALETIGDGEDLEYVAGLARMEADTSDLQAIRARARQVLPILQARQAEEQISGVLLRGASAPPPPNDQLLRATTAQLTVEPAHELLRPDGTSHTSSTVINEEVTKQDVSKMEVVSEEVISGEVIGGEVISGEVIGGEVISGEVIGGEIISDKNVDRKSFEERGRSSRTIYPQNGGTDDVEQIRLRQ